MRPLRLLSWGFLVALLALVAATWPDLPARVPTHLGADGQPDRWSDRSVLSWFGLAMIAVPVQVLLEVLARIIPDRPQLLNVPDKEKLVAMPPAWRAGAMREVVRLMDVTMLFVTGLFFAVQWQIVQVTQGRPGLPPVLIHVSAIGFTVGLLLFVARITNAIDAAHRAWTDAGAPPA